MKTLLLSYQMFSCHYNYTLGWQCLNFETLLLECKETITYYSRSQSKGGQVENRLIQLTAATTMRPMSSASKLKSDKPTKVALSRPPDYAINSEVCCHKKS